MSQSDLYLGFEKTELAEVFERNVHIVGCGSYSAHVTHQEAVITKAAIEYFTSAQPTLTYSGEPGFFWLRVNV